MKPNRELFYLQTWMGFSDATPSGKIYKSEKVMLNKIKYFPPGVKYTVFKANVEWEEILSSEEPE